MSQYNRESSTGGRNQYDITDKDMAEHRENWEETMSNSINKHYVFNESTDFRVLEENKTELTIELGSDSTTLTTRVSRTDFNDGIRQGTIKQVTE